MEKDVGVITDSKLLFDNHIPEIAKYVNFAVRPLTTIHKTSF